MLEQGQVVCQHLAEAEAGVDHQPLAADACCFAGRDAILQEMPHLFHHIGIAWRLLHALRLTLHVHQAHRRIGRGHCFQCAGRAQGHDVVHHGRAGIERRSHHLGLHRVDRHHAAAAGQVLDHRQHAPHFLVHGHRCRAGPGGLASDIEDIGARFQQLERMADRRLRIVQTAPVRKRIGRDVDDAHDEGPCEGEAVRTCVEKGHKKEEPKPLYCSA